MKDYDSYCKMSSVLRNTGIYSLTGNTAVDCELRAYSAGIVLVVDELRELDNELFIETARDYGLTLRQRLCSFPATTMTASQLRTALALYFSEEASRFTKSGIISALSSLGIDAEITENGGCSVTVTINACSLSDSSEDNIKAPAERFIPPYLQTEYVFPSRNVIQ